MVRVVEVASDGGPNSAGVRIEAPIKSTSSMFFAAATISGSAEIGALKTTRTDNPPVNSPPLQPRVNVFFRVLGLEYERRFGALSAANAVKCAVKFC